MMDHLNPTPAFAIAAILCGSILSANAHEMWIEPIQYQLPDNGKVEAHLKIGQNFNGYIYRYLPNQFVRFTLTNGDQTRDVEGRTGDAPALSINASGDGLQVFGYQSTVQTTSYESLDKFATFLEHKDLAWALDEHEKRDLPQAGFREAYRRYIKSLVGAGSSAGDDQKLGFDVEFQLLENPYKGDMTDGLEAILYRFGQEWRNQQVEVFERPIGGQPLERRFLLRTDEAGLVTVPVRKGYQYLLDAVHIRIPSDETAQAHSVVWETLWASMTFAVPDR